MVIVLARNVVSLLIMSVLTYQDLKKMMISKKIVYFYLIIGVVVGSYLETPLGTIIALIPGAALLLLSYLTGEKIGYGDGLVVMALGAMMGIYTLAIIIIVGMVLLCFYSLGVAITSILIERHISAEYKIPLIPFIMAGMVMCFGIM